MRRLPPAKTRTWLVPALATRFDAIACAKQRTTRGTVPRVLCSRVPTK